MTSRDPHTKAVRALSLADARLAAVIERVGTCRLPMPDGGEHFTGLVRAIVSQQLSGKAAETIFGRVATRVGDPFAPKGLLAVPELDLRTAGLSRAKARAVIELAQAVESGRLDLRDLDRLEDEAVIDMLSAQRGIGRWTAEMILMFRLGRPDVLPVDDLGIKKGMMLLFRLRKLPSVERMEKLAKPWRPHRTVACWYLWRLTELGP